MSTQEAIALGIVAITVVVFAWGWLRPRKARLARNSPCGCGGGDASEAPTILFRVRKGEASQIIIRSR